MNLAGAHLYNELFLVMQNQFNFSVCEELFGSLAEHLYDKWSYSDRNMLFYLTRLDSYNKDKVLKWGLRLLQEKDYLII